MEIDEKILRRAGASILRCNKGEIIFMEGETPHCYMQIIRGQVKLNSYDHDGKEFIQNILEDGDSLAESIIIASTVYPMNAIALKQSTIIKLPKERLLGLLETKPELLMDLCNSMANRLNQKIFMLQNNSIKCPKEKIKGLLNYMRRFKSSNSDFFFEIPLTRQQIANIIGLTVETVIRNIKILESENLLMIKNRKIFV